MSDYANILSRIAEVLAEKGVAAAIPHIIGFVREHAPSEDIRKQLDELAAGVRTATVERVAVNGNEPDAE